MYKSFLVIKINGKYFNGVYTLNKEKYAVFDGFDEKYTKKFAKVKTVKKWIEKLNTEILGEHRLSYEVINHNQFEIHSILGNSDCKLLV
ncbi:MAG: hypothetical protein RR598_04310 [Anaerorhabdus sp.]